MLPKLTNNLGTALVMLLTAALAALAVGMLWLHIGIQPVLSASMRPTFGPGWAVFTVPTPLREVHTGEILVFRPPGESSAYAHRVVSVTWSGGSPVITTKGDHNQMADPWHAKLTGTTVPRVIGEVPVLGRAMLAFHEKWARELLLLSVGLTVSVVGARGILSPTGLSRGKRAGFSPVRGSHFRPADN